MLPLSIIHSAKNYYIIYLIFVLLFTSTDSTKSHFGSSVFIFYDKNDGFRYKCELLHLDYWCSGSIISPWLVISSASCFDESQNASKYIITPTQGDTQYADSRLFQPYTVRKLLLHEAWGNESKQGPNVAIMQVNTKIGLSQKITAAILPTTSTGTDCQSMFWQKTFDKSNALVFKPVVSNAYLSTESMCSKEMYEHCYTQMGEENNCLCVHGGLLVCNGDVLQGLAVSSRASSQNMVCVAHQRLTVAYMDVFGLEPWIQNFLQMERKWTHRMSSTASSSVHCMLILSVGFVLIKYI